MNEQAIVVSELGKAYRRYHPDRPATIQEAIAKRRLWMRPVEWSWALRDVSFSVGSGKTVGIIGSNGSGKSTLLRLIGGIGRPDTGRVEVFGRLGALLDLGAGFHPDLSGRENALLSGILNGMTRQQVLDRMDAIIAFSEIPESIDNPVRTYSSGMQMRLAFSTAIHTEPEILLIDEVLAVGDVAFQRKCLDRISQFRNAGCSIVIVSHDSRVVRDLCDEAIWMNKGRLMEHGPALEVVGHYIKHMEGVGPAFKKRDWLPPTWYPAATECKPLNNEPILSDTRFGTQECEIVGVHVLDRFDSEVKIIASGQPLRIVLDYRAASRVTAPIFHVRISRDDGLVCYDCSVKLPDLGVPAIEGSGHVSLALDRLDLNSATYVVDVGCYAKTWAAAYDCQISAKTFTVRGNNVRGAILNTMHHWEAAASGDTAVLSSEPEVVPSKSA